MMAWNLYLALLLALKQADDVEANMGQRFYHITSSNPQAVSSRDVGCYISHRTSSYCGAGGPVRKHCY